MLRENDLHSLASGMKVIEYGSKNSDVFISEKTGNLLWLEVEVIKGKQEKLGADIFGSAPALAHWHWLNGFMLKRINIIYCVVVLAVTGFGSGCFWL